MLVVALAVLQGPALCTMEPAVDPFGSSLEAFDCKLGSGHPKVREQSPWPKDFGRCFVCFAVFFCLANL